jgi:hypothetical protein
VEDRKIGVVYILRDPRHPERFKIGLTTNGSEKRNDEIKKNCETDMEVVYTVKSLMSARRAEQICHAEVANHLDTTSRSKCYKCPRNKSSRKTHVQHTDITLFLLSSHSEQSTDGCVISAKNHMTAMAS